MEGIGRALLVLGAVVHLSSAGLLPARGFIGNSLGGIDTAAVETVNVGDGIVGQGIVYGNRQLVKSIVFNGRSIVIDGTVYDGTHCTHNGYVYDARYVGGFPTVFGYPVGYGVYNGYNVFSDNILFDGSSFVIGGRSFAGSHIVHSGFEYDGYLVDNLRVVYGHSTSYNVFSNNILFD